MEDLEGKIGEILNDPETMSNIFSMVQGLGLTPPTEEAPPLDLGGLDVMPLLSALTSATETDSKEAALFGALRPFLKPERQAKLDRAMKVGQLSKVATAALKTMDL